MWWHILASMMLACVVDLAAAETFPALEARAWLLIDASSGQTLAEHNADQRVEPASLTKLMTAYLAFTALQEGRLKPEQRPPVSERAWRAEGSRMFLDPKQPARIDELLKGMIVQSGNDASIVLAEAIGKSEEAFAAQMNDMARRLGMTSTHFVNATGLPHSEHFTTARDLALLSRTLITRFPNYYALYSLKEYTYNRISQPNRNRLLWMDPNVDGLKTGHTERAGYCLVASVRRGDRRLISVVLGASSDATRASESQKLLNFGLAHYETVRLYRANQRVARIRLYRGTENEVEAGFLYDLQVTVPRGQGTRLTAQIVRQDPQLAPIARGQRIAILRVSLDGKPLADYPLVALQGVETAGLIGRGIDNLLLLFR